MKSSKSPTMPNFMADSSFPLIFPSQPKYYIRFALGMQERFRVCPLFSERKGAAPPSGGAERGGGVTPPDRL
jgi:hypothetical protein